MPSTTLVINEVYGGGGNSGATYTHDFIEVKNIGTTTVDVSGYSVQYTSAGTTGIVYQVTNLSGRSRRERPTWSRRRRAPEAPPRCPHLTRPARS